MSHVQDPQNEKANAGGPASRRTFLTGVAVAAGASILPSSGLFAGPGDSFNPFFAGQPTGATAGIPTDAAQQFAGIPGRTVDEQILNFALTLEILEFNLYRTALNQASGLPLSAALSDDPAFYTRQAQAGSFTVTQADVAFEYLVTFTYVERQHRRFINNAIVASGGTPVERNPNGYAFPSIATTMPEILRAILPLEETGVRAYLGALPYFTDLGLATIAAGIYSTEARHSAVLGALLARDAGPAPRAGDVAVIDDQPSQNTFEYFLTPRQTLSAASVYFL